MAMDIFLDVCGSTVDESMYNQGPRWLPPPSKPLVPLYTSKTWRTSVNIVKSTVPGNKIITVYIWEHDSSSEIKNGSNMQSTYMGRGRKHGNHDITRLWNFKWRLLCGDSIVWEFLHRIFISDMAYSAIIGQGRSIRLNISFFFHRWANKFWTRKSMNSIYDHEHVRIGRDLHIMNSHFISSRNQVPCHMGSHIPESNESYILKSTSNSWKPISQP